MVRGRVILVICAAAAIVGAALINYGMFIRGRFGGMDLVGFALLMLSGIVVLGTNKWEDRKPQRYLVLFGVFAFFVFSDIFLSRQVKTALYSVIIGMVAGQIWCEAQRRWPTGRLGRIDGSNGVVPPDPLWRS